MSWRTVVVTERAKLTYLDDYLIIHKNEVHKVHLSEIGTIVVDSTMVTITTHLINELFNNKIKLIICDSRHNPSGEVMPYYNNYVAAKRLRNQIAWEDARKGALWTAIVRAKIANQAAVLSSHRLIQADKLYGYLEELEYNDESNREGHAAKVYFNAMFGLAFCRNDSNSINAALDYGYSILLSAFNRVVAAQGYNTMLGLKHCNDFNFFNLSCDLMEPFRPLVDLIVYSRQGTEFDSSYKHALVNMLNSSQSYDGKEQFLSNLIGNFVSSCMRFLEEGIEIKMFELSLSNE